MDLKLTTDFHDDGLAVVKVDGDADVYTSPRLREHLGDLIGACRYLLVIDLEQCEYLDSTGLGVLVGALKKVRAKDGRIAIACTAGPILHTFRITGLTKVLGVCPTVDEAAQSLLAGAP